MLKSHTDAGEEKTEAWVKLTPGQADKNPHLAGYSLERASKVTGRTPAQVGCYFVMLKRI